MLGLAYYAMLTTNNTIFTLFRCPILSIFEIRWFLVWEESSAMDCLCNVLLPWQADMLYMNTFYKLICLVWHIMLCWLQIIQFLPYWDVQFCQYLKYCDFEFEKKVVSWTISAMSFYHGRRIYAFHRHNL